MNFITRNKIPLLLLLLGVLIFANLLGADRLHTWDDNRYLDENELVQNFQVGRILSEFYFASYIPVTLLSYAVEYRIWGLSSGGFHAVNLLLHAFNGVLVFLFLYQFSGRRTAALIAAVLFICHPVQVETVAWISQRKNLLCMFFFLLAFISHIRSRRENSIKWQGAAWGFYLLAVLSKPAVLGAPVLFIAYDYLWAKVPWRRMALNALPMITIALFGITVLMLNAFQVGGILPHWGGSRLSALQLTFLVTWEYLVGLVNPATLKIHYVYFAPDAITGNFRVWAGMFLLLAFSGASLYSLWRYLKTRSNPPLLFFAYLWVMIFMLPVSNIIPINVQRADRFLYFPSIMLFLGVGIGWQWLWQRHQNAMKRYLLVGATLAVVLFFIIATYQRNQLWADDGTLWTYQLEKVPNDDIAIGNLALHNYITKQYANAIPLYKRLAELDPGNYRPPLFLGLMAYDEGRYEASIRAFHQALPLVITQVSQSKEASTLGRISGDFINVIREKLLCAYIEAIALANREQRGDDAKRYSNEMLATVPGPADLYNSIGYMYFNENRYDEALVAFDVTVKVNPEYALGHTNIGIVAHALGKNQWANQAFKRALEIDPEFEPALNSYCTFLLNTGGDDEEVCRRAKEKQS